MQGHPVVSVPPDVETGAQQQVALLADLSHWALLCGAAVLHLFARFRLPRQGPIAACLFLEASPTSRVSMAGGGKSPVSFDARKAGPACSSGRVVAEAGDHILDELRFLRFTVKGTGALQ